jgi:MoaA/NifB/PqqE/SkfB family radical SAM enzyme
MAEIKSLINLDRVALSDAVPLDMPYAIYAFPTTYCNFKCVYCAHAIGLEKMREQYDFVPQNMPMDTYCIIIEQMKSFPRPVKLLSLTGQGEPLINKNIAEMVRLAKRAGIANRIEIITNAALLTGEMSDRLIGAGLDGLRVSLQGIGSKRYKEICGVDIDFDVFLSQIRYFYENKGKCDLYVKIMDVTLNNGDEDRFYEVFNNISDRMFIERCRPAYNGVPFTTNLPDDKLDRQGNNHEHRLVCPLCFFQLGIYPNGDVEPDDTIYRPVILGNVHTDTLKDMWAGKTLHDFWLMQLHGERSNNPKCAVCVAPDDVSHELDVLDYAATEIINRMEHKDI